MLRLRIVAAAILLAVPGGAAAHGDDDHSSIGWNFDLWVTAPLALTLLVFVVGYLRLAERSKIDRRHSWLFVGGWAVLALSLLSPLHEGGEVSFTLHMIEHELIMLVATFLLAASDAGGILAWGLPAAVRRSLGGGWKSSLTWLWRQLTQPVTATLVQAAVMWLWHAPSLFDRALENEGWHVAQHVSFVAGSLLFWVAMLRPRRGGYLLSAACLFVTSLIEGALGALMALSTSPWYAAYARMDLSGIGLDPTTDQQLAGLLMWIPGGLLHGGVTIYLLYKWLSDSNSGGRHALRAH